MQLASDSCSRALASRLQSRPSLDCTTLARTAPPPCGMAACPEPPVDADCNLLFGVLALQADLLTPSRFAEACAAWAARRQTPLADLLVERGWLDPSDRADVEKLLRRKLTKHGGDAAASLAEVTTDQIRESLADVNDTDVRLSLAPPSVGDALVHTAEFAPESRER